MFAVAAQAGAIKLYDVRSYDKGPFDTFVVSVGLAQVEPPLREVGLRKWRAVCVRGR